MNWVLLALLISLFSYGMEEGSSGYSLERVYTEEDEDMTKVVVSFYFPNSKNHIDEDIIPRVKRRIADSRDDVAQNEALKELRALKEKIKKRKRSSSSAGCLTSEDIHGNSTCLHDYIARVITESVDEALSDKNEHSRRVERAYKKKYERALLTAGGSIMSALIVGTISLVVHFNPQ